MGGMAGGVAPVRPMGPGGMAGRPGSPNGRRGAYASGATGAYTGRPRDRGSHWRSNGAKDTSIRQYDNGAANNIRRHMAARQGSVSPSNASNMMRRGQDGGASARAARRARSSGFAGDQGYNAGYQGNSMGSPMGPPMGSRQDGELRARVNSLEEANQRQEADLRDLMAREESARREASEARAREESWKRQYADFENRISEEVEDLSARAQDASTFQSNAQARMSRLEQSTERVEENLADVMERDQGASRQVAEWRAREEQLTRRLSELEDVIGLEPMEGPGRAPSPGPKYGRGPRGRSGRSPGRSRPYGPAGDWRAGPEAPWDEPPFPEVAPLGERPRRGFSPRGGPGRAGLRGAEARAQQRWEREQGPGPSDWPWDQNEYPSEGPPGAAGAMGGAPGVMWEPSMGGPEAGRPVSAQDLTAQSRANYDANQRAKGPADAAWAQNRDRAASGTGIGQWN